MANIMIVDDSKLVRKSISDVLTRVGHSIVCECERGDDALTKYITYKPDIVTMDINMPGMDGIQSTSQIIKKYPDAKIIIISAHSQEKMILEGISRGASCFIVKPFTDDHIIRTVNRLSVEILKKDLNKKDYTLPEELKTDQKLSGLVLIIDDSKLFLQVTADLLKKDGYTVITALNGKDGLELAKTGNPDLIILDIVMPDIDGYEVLKELKKDMFTKNIPVIMYSSKTKKEDILPAMKLGVVDYISKNCEEKVLIGKTRSALLHAKHKKMVMARNEVANIIIERQGRITYITFRITLKSEGAIAERKKVFTEAFLEMLSDTELIFDYRFIENMDASEISQLKYLFILFSDRELNIVCGKHYGAFVSSFDTEGRNRFFISMGDAELYIGSRKKPGESLLEDFLK